MHTAAFYFFSKMVGGECVGRRAISHRANKSPALYFYLKNIKMIMKLKLVWVALESCFISNIFLYLYK